MEKQILIEINRFREISKLPLLSEGPPPSWLDNLVTGVSRIKNIDDIISRLGYKEGEILTDKQINAFTKELELSGLDPKLAKKVSEAFMDNALLRKALTNKSDDFVGLLKKSTAVDAVKGIGIVHQLTPDVIAALGKRAATELLNTNTWYVTKLKNIDTAFSDLLQKIYDRGEILHNIDEMYDVFDGLLNDALIDLNLTDDYADTILQAFKDKYRGSSKTKTILDKFKEEGRVLNGKRRTTPYDKYTTTKLVPEWKKTSKWRAVDPVTNTPIKHVPPVVDDVVDMEFDVAGISGADDATETGNEILDGNLFNTTGPDGLDKEFLSSFQKLAKATDDLPKDSELKILLSEILGAIRQGKKIKRWKNISQKNMDLDALKNALPEPDYSRIANRLENPKPMLKSRPLGTFYWTKVEPILTGLRELYKGGDYINKLLRRQTKTPNEYFNEFKSSLESKIINPKSVFTDAEVKKLKDQFQRLTKDIIEQDVSYKDLWDDMDKYVKNGLDNKSLQTWENIKSILQAENPNNWRWVTWKEMTGDTNIISSTEKVIKDYIEKKPLTPQGIAEGSVVTAGEGVVKGVAKKALKLYGYNLLSVFFTGTWKTPKEMKMFLLSKGYASEKVPLELLGLPIFNLKLSAGGVLFFKRAFSKYILIPILWGVWDAVSEEFREKFGIVSDDKTGFDQKLKKWIYNEMINKGDGFVWNYFRELTSEWYPILKRDHPDWYPPIRRIMGVVMGSPAGNIILNTADVFATIKKDTEVFENEVLDQVIKDANEQLKKEKISDKINDNFSLTQRTINDTMVEMGVIRLDVAKNVTDNMYLNVGVDEKIVQSLRDAIKAGNKDNTGLFDKVKGVLDKTKSIKELTDSPVADIMVKSKDGTFKLVDAGEFGIQYEDANGESHPLNELKF